MMIRGVVLYQGIASAMLLRVSRDRAFQALDGQRLKPGCGDGLLVWLKPYPDTSKK